MIRIRDLILAGYLVEFAICGLLTAVLWSAWSRFRSPALRHWAAAFACLMAFLLARASAQWPALPPVVLVLRGAFALAAACAHAALLVLGARALVAGADVPRRRARVGLALAIGVPAALLALVAGSWPEHVPEVRTGILLSVNAAALGFLLRLSRASSRAGNGRRIALVGLAANVTSQLAYLAAFLPLDPGSWLGARLWLFGFGDALWQPLVGFGLVLWYLEHEHEAALAASAEARRNAAALVESQKLRTVHLLSGGMVHDCVNALTIVQGCSDVLRERVRDRSSLELVDSIHEAACRASELARRGFAAGGSNEPSEDLCVRTALEQASHWLRHLLGPNVRLELEFAAEVPEVHCRPSDLQQILANLAANARDALRGGGTLWIRLGAASGPALAWIFEDDGPGIDPAIRAHLFEPFVSTKRKDAGSGIGLASVRACVELLGGTIQAGARPGGGARFEIRLPAVRSVPRSPQVS